MGLTLQMGLLVIKGSGLVEEVAREIERESRRRRRRRREARMKRMRDGLWKEPHVSGELRGEVLMESEGR